MDSDSLPARHYRSVDSDNRRFWQSPPLVTFGILPKQLFGRPFFREKTGKIFADHPKKLRFSRVRRNSEFYG